MRKLSVATLTKSLLCSVVIAALNATVISRVAAEPCQMPTFLAVKNSYAAPTAAAISVDSLQLGLQRVCRSGQVGNASNTVKSHAPETPLAAPPRKTEASHAAAVSSSSKGTGQGTVPKKSQQTSASSSSKCDVVKANPGDPDPCAPTVKPLNNSASANSGPAKTSSGSNTSNSTGPTFAPSNVPCCDAPVGYGEPQPTDLLADPRGQGSIADALSPEQREKLNQMIDEWARDQVKGLVAKPFEKPLEAVKKSFQEDVATFGAGAAIALCGANPACGPIGFGAGWYAGGKAFDKAVEAALSSTFSGCAC